MTGPEHYREAERLVDLADEQARHLSAEQQMVLVSAAQTHATLALVAATVAPRSLGPQESWGGQMILVSGAWVGVGDPHA